MNSDDILLFLVKNSKSQSFLPVEVKGNKPNKLRDLLLRLSGVTTYMCPLEALESFLGEKVDFEKHLRPLHKTKGPLYFSGVPEEGSFYDSPKYRETLKHVTGQVRDYTTGQSFISFTYGENEFLTDYYTILENATELKLLKMKKSEVSALKKSA